MVWHRLDVVARGARGHRLEGRDIVELRGLGAGRIQPGEVAQRPIAGKRGEQYRFRPLTGDRAHAHGGRENVLPDPVERGAVGLQRQDDLQIGKGDRGHGAVGVRETGGLVRELAADAGGDHQSGPSGEGRMDKHSGQAGRADDHGGEMGRREAARPGREETRLHPARRMGRGVAPRSRALDGEHALGGVKVVLDSETDEQHERRRRELLAQATEAEARGKEEPARQGPLDGRGGKAAGTGRLRRLARRSRRSRRRVHRRHQTLARDGRFYVAGTNPVTGDRLAWNAGVYARPGKVANEVGARHARRGAREAKPDC